MLPEGRMPLAPCVLVVEGACQLGLAKNVLHEPERQPRCRRGLLGFGPD